MTIVGKAWRNALIISLILAAFFVITRLTNLTKLPIFTDEAIYIRWSQIGSRDANWRFISLVDGKQPLFTWIMMAFLKIIPDPLFAGRLVSVFAGIGSMAGIWLLAHEIFKNKRIATIASMLYLVSPFTLMYDRMALYDSLVATFSIWNLYLAILLVRHLRLDVALIYGMTLGLGMLNKSSGFLSLYLIPITLVLMDWRRVGRYQRLLKWVGLAIIAALISQALYSVLRLSPLFHMVTEKDAVFVYPLKDWIMHPLQFVEGNLRGEFDWIWHYLTLPVFIASLLPMVLLRPNIREKLLLYAMWLAPFVALALFGRVLYPRFILFMTMPLLILAAVSIDWIIMRYVKTYLGLALLFVLFFPSIYASFFIITNPIYAPIPFADKGQFINDWPTGWGMREVNSYLLDKSQKSKISIYTEGTFGLLPYAVEIYLVDNPNIKIKGIWPVPVIIPEEFLSDARKYPTYFILNQMQSPPRDWPLELIAEYQKGDNKGQKLRLFKVLAPKASNI